MRRIASKEESEKVQKRRIRILSLFMLIILVASTMGYSFLQSPEDKKTSSNTGVVEDASGRWLVKIGEQTLSFSNSPQSTKDVPVQVYKSLNDYYGKSVYIASDNQAAAYEIASTLGNYASRVQPACYGNCSQDLPVKNCSDNLIVWKDSTENKVYQEDSCIFIEGDLKAIDAFLYNIFGVKQD
jgi:hypothetical protein